MEPGSVAMVAGGGVDLNSLFGKFFESAPMAAVLFAILILFARWVKKQIEYEREDKARCFDMHDALRTCIDNNTKSTDDLAEAFKDLKAPLQASLRKAAGPPGAA